MRSLAPFKPADSFFGESVPAPVGGHEHDVRPGDVVLYRTWMGHTAPARLLEPIGGGAWLARDARLARGLIHLDPASITARLPRSDLFGEAA